MRQKFMLRAALIAWLAFAAAPAWAAASAESVGHLMGDNAPLPKDSAETDAKIIDAFAATETKRLAPEDKAWGRANPKWVAVYDRVHADLQSQSTQITGPFKEKTRKLAEEFNAAIAANMSQADADAILAYYATPEGKRYLAFQTRIDAVMGHAADGGKQPATPLTKEQKDEYMRLLTLSSIYLSMAAMAETDSTAQRDLSGYNALGFMMGTTAARHRSALDALDAEYAKDLPAFEKFTQSDPARHMFMAMGKASREEATKMVPQILSHGAITDLPPSVAEKYRPEWQKFYMQQMAHS